MDTAQQMPHNVLAMLDHYKVEPLVGYKEKRSHSHKATKQYTMIISDSETD